MRTIKPRTEHWISEPRRNVHTGEITARGVSSWDMPDGARLRREMSRSSTFTTIKEMQRWARRYKLDADRQTAKWLELEAAAEAAKIDAAIAATPNLINPPISKLLDDGGAGGTFTPAAIELTSDKPTAEFSYRPADKKTP